MKRTCDCVVGLREANVGSGVGLFNNTLAQRLGVPCFLLDNYAFSPAERPLLSLKFEELSPRHRQRLAEELFGRGPNAGYSLFLHTVDHSDLETRAVRGADLVLCGNDQILRTLRSREPKAVLVRAHAPSLIPEGFETSCRPAGLVCFTFGMAGKVDFVRFARLRDLLTEVEGDYRLLCSLAVHQTSDGTCLPQALDFLTNCFGDHFVYLGTLSDQGVAYFLNACPVFVGFYRGGVRSNNTTFNTALRFGNKIISNLDDHSPDEVKGLPYILDIDTAGPEQLRELLRAARPGQASRLFGWDELVRCCTAAAVPKTKVA